MVQIRAMPPPTQNGTFFDAMIEGHEQVLLARMMDEHLPAADLPFSAQDFSPVNRLIYEAIRDIDQADDGKPHLGRVTQHLEATRNLENAGGAGAITHIANLPHSP